MQFDSFAIFLIICLSIACVPLKAETPKRKKDLMDYNDADLERLFEQWEEQVRRLYSKFTFLNKQKKKHIFRMKTN